MAGKAAGAPGARDQRRRSEGEGGVAVRPTFFPLAVGGVLHADGQLAGVGVEARRVVHGWRARRRQRQLVRVARHAVERLGQVRRALQDDLLPDKQRLVKSASLNR